MDFDERLFLQDIQLEVTKNLRQLYYRANKGILKAVRELVRDTIKNSPEYRELTQNTPAYHQFGIPDILNRLNIVIEKIVENVSVIQGIEKSSVSGPASIDFEIKLLDASHSDVLNLAVSVFQTNKGDVLEWLRWLLFEGTTPVILQYHYIDEYSRASRTGLGLMVSRGYWNVPSELSGVYGDNWLTRSVDAIRNTLEDVVESEIRRYLE